MVNILLFASWDFAGVIWNLYNAINDHTEHTAHFVRMYPHPYGYKCEYDLKNMKKEVLLELFEGADIIHYNEWLMPQWPTDLGNGALKGKKVLGHFHGFTFRAVEEKRKLIKKSLNENKFSKILLSTPDLLKFRIPETDFSKYEYLPNPYPINNPLYAPLENKDWSIIKIAHCPYNPMMKNTPALMKNAKKLVEKGLKLQVHLASRTTHTECLKMKRQCHLLFDSISKESEDHKLEAVSLGVNGIEALPMGIPVFVKLDEQYSLPIFQKMTEEVGLKKIPLILVDEENLEEKLEELVRNPEKIKAIGEEGRIWGRKIFGSDAIAKKLIKIYEELPEYERI